MALKAVLFDLDGTLVDTRPWYLEILTNDLGAPAEVVRKAVAAHRPPVTIAKDHGITRGRLRSACRSARERLRLFPFTREALTGLRTRGVPIGLVTSCPRDMMDIVLEATGIRSLFDVVQPYQVGVSAKPRPDSLLLALQVLGILPSKAVAYVGDTMSDSQAAAAAGLSFGWVPFGHGSEQPAETTWTLSRLDALLTIADR